MKLMVIWGVKLKKNIFDCEKLCTPEFAKVIIQLYYHTGADAVSAFFGHGKKSVMKKALKCPAFTESLESVGAEIPASKSSIDILRAFTTKKKSNTC